MRKWAVWTSSDESVGSNTPSVLAVVETVAVVVAVFWLSYATGSLLPIALPAVFAPLLLLRTKVSSERNLRLFLAYCRFLDRLEYLGHEGPIYRRGTLKLFSAVLGVPLSLVSLTFRFVATVSSVVTHPATSVSAIPSNWWSVAACVDFTRAPELAPGIEKFQFPKETFISIVTRFTSLKEIALFSEPDDSIVRRYRDRIIGVLLLTFFILIWYVPAAWYRWTVKASSIVYAPLAWAVHATRGRGRSVEQRLEDIKDDELEKIRRAYSCFVIVVLTIAPFMLGIYVNQLMQNLDAGFSTELVHFWVFTGSVKLWHVARFVNAFLTISLFIYAGRALRKYRRRERLSEGAVSVFIRAVSGTRAFLGIYLSAKMLHLVVTAVDWRSIDWEIVPW